MCENRRITAEESRSAVNVFVTGQPGIGKTTLVLNVAKLLPQDCIAGFYTVEAKAEGTGERIGLDCVTFSGERAPLCRLRRGCGPKIGKYYVAISELERVIVPQLIPDKKIKLHIIDEIGRLELCSEKFREAVFKLLDSPRAVFGSLPAPRYGHTLDEVEEIKQRADTAVLTLTKANREGTAQQVTELLKRLIQNAKEEDGEDEEQEEREGGEGGDKRPGCHNSTGEGGAGPAGAEDSEPCNSEKGENSHPSSSNGEVPKRGQSLEDALAQVADAILD